MSESSPPRQPLYLDASVNSNIELRQNTHLSVISPALASAPDWQINPVFAPPASLLNSPRSSPEQPESDGIMGRRGSRPDVLEDISQTLISEPASPEDESNFRRSLQIDMKGLVGDAVGNMSVSPSSRDIVLAARRGLFIIDLEAPLEIPRFLPQGGTWDVADVQWNPHPSRAEYIVSTSSEKLLIWNLLLVGKTSIEFILQAHYRAITDINWHTTECDTVISTGIDSWLWAWDLRETRKPIFGLSAFESGGTQVKWNRQDANILASSHSNEVLIWDRRKGSLPLKRIRAHSSKIYGIDWAHDRRDELVTCSLDKTIKIWDTSTAQEEPQTTIRTAYPVWRARALPFGRGVLSLPQRGATALELYGHNGSESPVERYEGHTDVVKEFVWRRGGEDDFQLITWSKDRTLRFWPIEPEIMEQVGSDSPVTRGRGRTRTAHRSSSISYRNPPNGTGYLPALSAPVGHRSILAEVRAPLPPRPVPVVATARSQGGTMSRGNPNNNSTRAPMDAFTWLSNVKVGERRGSSEGVGVDSAEVSRLREKLVESGKAEGFVIGEMDVESEKEKEKEKEKESERRKRSESRARVEVEASQNPNQSLQDEITSVLTKLSTSKIKLEKHDLTKKRTCTLGLHGPWGGSSSVFIRVTFTFPRDYPQASYPHGIPIVELERNPLITPKDRAFILRRLTAIREHRRPCLENCLRFLLFRDEKERLGEPTPADLESSSSEDEGPPLPNGARRHKDKAVTVLRSSKNLVEPRTSQGVFGPNGELICFFRAPTRIVRNILRGLSNSPATPAEESASASATVEPTPAPRMFQSPSLISDAVRRLGLSARDRQAKGLDSTRHLADRHNILRIMTNLLTLQPKLKSQVSDNEHRPLGDLLKKSYALLAPRRSTIFLVNTTNFAGSDRKVAKDYIFGRTEDVVQTPSKNDVTELRDVCATNARAARLHGRYDHERVFKTIQALLPESSQPEQDFGALAIKVINGLYIDFAKNKDIQMLAMLSMLLLQIKQVTTSTPPIFYNAEPGSNPQTSMPRSSAIDYFSHKFSPKAERPPGWPGISPTPTALHQQQSTLSSSSSSRGSWSSLFNSGSVRQFMSGVQGTLRDGLTTPLEFTTSAANTLSNLAIELPDTVPPVLKVDKMIHVANGRRRRGSNIPSMTPRSGPVIAPSPPLMISKSWSESLPQPLKPTSSLTSIGHSKAPLAKLKDPGNMRVAGYKRVIVFEPQAEQAPEQTPDFFTEAVLYQLRSHVHAYADLLCRWELYHKRSELLKAVRRQTLLFDGNKAHTMGIARTCPRCEETLPQNANYCPLCSLPCSSTKCTVCRLPVKGLSLFCLQCFHVSHITCWNKLDVPICATGCGCFCNGIEDTPTRPSSRHEYASSPPPTSLVLSSFT